MWGLGLEIKLCFVLFFGSRCVGWAGGRVIACVLGAWATLPAGGLWVVYSFIYLRCGGWL